MPTRIRVIGDYGHHNVGNEQYKETFQTVFSQCLPTFYVYSLDFIDCNDIQTCEFEEEDVIIVGGGDVLHDYFLDKLIARFQNRRNRIIAVSVGLPSTKTLTNANKLSLIDYIFVRTKQDFEVFAEYFHPHRIGYVPDLSYALMLKENSNVPPLPESSPTGKLVRSLQMAKSTGRAMVCINLNRQFFHAEQPQQYQDMVRTIGQFVKFLVNFQFHVVFIPYSTDSNTPAENDLIFQRHVADYLAQTNIAALACVTMVDEEIDAQTILMLMNFIDFSIPMRFHACLFSVYKRVPCLPVFFTRDIRNLLLDVNWVYGYELPTNEFGTPQCIELGILIQRFTGMVESYRHRPYMKNKLEDINLCQLGKEFTGNVVSLFGVLTQPCRQEKAVAQSERVQQVRQLLADFALSYGYDDFRLVQEEKLRDVMVGMVSFHLTGGSIDSKFKYGLRSKMFEPTYDSEREWTWIFNEHTASGHAKLMNNPYGLFNLSFSDQNDYSGAHRSGWQYVYDSLKYLHSDESSLFLDLYVDRTFHWNLDVNKQIGVVPYTTPWVGFIHHTFDTSFSKYNCHALFSCGEFLKSLHCCQGLCVLSEYLKCKLRAELDKLGMNTPVYVFTHPTEMAVPHFDCDKFTANCDRKLLHIGGWLRNIYSFYRLNSAGYRKVALKGKNMSNYFPLSGFMNTVHMALSAQDAEEPVMQTPRSNASRNETHEYKGRRLQVVNNWHKHFYEDLTRTMKSVDFMEYLENAQFDQLFTENIVFLHLVDASAVNTILECIARHTPIIVNDHPAVVEMLGHDYPLYYRADSNNHAKINEQVQKLLLDNVVLHQAHTYLRNLDKTRFTIDNFMAKFVDVIRTIKEG